MQNTLEKTFNIEYKPAKYDGQVKIIRLTIKEDLLDHLIGEKHQEGSNTEGEGIRKIRKDSIVRMIEIE